MSDALTDGYLDLVRGIGYVRPARANGSYWLPDTEAEIDLTRQAQALDAARVSLLAEVDRLRARVSELEAAQSTVVAERDAQIIAWLEKEAREEGDSNKERRTRADVLYRMADKLSRGAVRPPLSKGPDPLIVSRFDVAIEPAPEDEQVLTIGCIDENSRPVALLLDMEARSKVARWLAPERNDTGRAATT